MNNQFIEARELIAKAREALRRGDKPSARQLGEQAALRAPAMEDAWLILAASDPNPEESLAYAQKALELNPQSGRAHRAVEWAVGRLKQVEATKDHRPTPSTVVPNQAEAVTSLPPKHAYQTAVAMPALKPQGRNWLLPALLAGAGLLLVGFILLFALTSPALASLVSSVSAAPTQEKLWAQVDIAKPEVTPIGGSAFAVQPANTSTAVPTAVAPTSVPSDVPTQAPTEAPTEAPVASPLPAVTETPASLAMQIIEDTPTSEYVAPAYNAPQDQIVSAGNGEHWIDVDLTNQRVYAYEGNTVVNSFIVSTGVRGTPTVTGKYKIYIKLRYGDMRGPGYFLPNVPYVMYFYKSYGLHGTYWHHNFGTPMSHGCVNLSIPDAAWLYGWAPLGTVVNVHY